MIQATAMILTGGQSRRMNGKDKAFARYKGKSFLLHAIENASGFEEIFVVTSERNFESQKDWIEVTSGSIDEPLLNRVRVITDFDFNKGPLEGIYTGIKHASYENTAVFAIDMPLITADLYCFLYDRMQESDAVVPEVDGYLQPLCAVYSARCEAVFERALSSNDLMLVRAFDKLNVKIIHEEELISSGFKKEQFININTNEELMAIQNKSAKECDE